MKLTIALDGERRRDLEFFSGDDNEIVLTVYENDGDEEPISISDATIVYGPWGGSSMTVGGDFRNSFNQREPYSIVGYVDSRRTTLAYGLLVRKWTDYCARYDGMYEPLYVRNEVSGGTAATYFEGPGTDGGDA